jgi:hypothetical protein
MAIKTFTDLTTLPASDINTYLNFGGLVYVKQQTVGTGVSSLTVTNAFSSEYDNYRIIYSGGVASNQANIWLRVGSLATNYFGAVTGTSYFTGGVVGIGLNNGTVWYGGSCGTTFATLDCDIFAPNVANRKTLLHSKWFYNTTNDAYSQFIGETTSTSQYTDFTLFTSSGTLTGGNICVYGYRQA